MNNKVHKQLLDIGINDISEIIYNPSYELLYDEENSNQLQGYEKVQKTLSDGEKCGDVVRQTLARSFTK